MPTPAKPYLVLASEGKSHRTKEEMKHRKDGEEAISTGLKLKERPEVKRNKIAHAEFKRLNSLLDKIKKNDAIHEAVINRYCLMTAECADLEEKREKIYEQAARLEQALDEIEESVSFCDLRDAIADIAHIYAAMIACDKQIQSKRKMLFDIEKENIMTIAAALRTIPKSSNDKPNPLRAALRDD